MTVNVPQTIWYDNDNPRQSDKDGQAVLDDQGNPTNEPANGDTFKASSNLFQDMTDHMSKISQLTRANGALSNTATFPTKEEKADIPAAFNAKMGDEGRLILQQMNLDADTTLGNTAGSKVYTTEKPTSNADNGLTLSDLRGVDFNDTKWDQLLDQLDLSESDLYVALAASYDQTAQISSISKPATVDFDGPQGIVGAIADDAEYTRIRQSQSSRPPSTRISAGRWAIASARKPRRRESTPDMCQLRISIAHHSPDVISNTIQRIRCSPAIC